MKKTAFCYALLLCLFTGFKSPVTTGTLQIQVTDLRNNQGVVNMTLFSGEEGFPSEDAKAFKKASATISNQRCTIVFQDVPAGEYAIAMMHDENDNKKMDFKMGMPKEGYGASNDAKALFGPPKYKDAKFRFTTSETTLQLKMRYF
jgi:uncharacterized protein (DUF2141 family)